MADARVAVRQDTSPDRNLDFEQLTIGGFTVYRQRVQNPESDVLLTNILNAVGGLVPQTYDYISLSYTGTDLTGVVYKTGGAGGTTVATLTLTYLAGLLQSVTRT